MRSLMVTSDHGPALICQALNAAQMPPIGLNQIILDHRMQRRLDAGIPLRSLEDFLCAATAQHITDQHAARTIDKGVERQGVLALVLHDANFEPAPRTGIAIIEPITFDSGPKLGFAAREKLGQHGFSVFAWVHRLIFQSDSLCTQEVECSRCRRILPHLSDRAMSALVSSWTRPTSSRDSPTAAITERKRACCLRRWWPPGCPSKPGRSR